MNTKPLSYGSMASTSDLQFSSGNSQTEFNNLSDNIGTNIYTINQSCKTLESCSRSMGTNKDNDGLRNKLHVTQLSTNEIVSVTTMNLQKLVLLVRKMDKQKKLQVEKLQEDFSDSINRYSKLQMDLKQKISSFPLISEQSMEAAGDDTLLQEQMLEHQRLHQEQESLLDRESRIKNIEVKIIDVNCIMKEIGETILKQREGIDTLESHIDYTVGHVEEGTSHLVKAEGYQNKYRRKLCFLVIIAFVVSAILVTILVTQLKKN